MRPDFLRFFRSTGQSCCGNVKTTHPSHASRVPPSLLGKARRLRRATSLLSQCHIPPSLSLRTSPQTGVAISDAEQRISWYKKIPTAVCALPRNDGKSVIAFPVPQHWCGNLNLPFTTGVVTEGNALGCNLSPPPTGAGFPFFLSAPWKQYTKTSYISTETYTPVSGKGVDPGFRVCYSY